MLFAGVVAPAFCIKFYTYDSAFHKRRRESLVSNVNYWINTILAQIICYLGIVVHIPRLVSSLALYGFRIYLAIKILWEKRVCLPMYFSALATGRITVKHVNRKKVALKLLSRGG